MQNRELVRVGEDVDLPLTGSIAFGVIDRGTNLLQIRPSSGCNLSCPFCSVDEGPAGEKAARYEVSLDYMVEYAGAIVARKDSDKIEMHIDGCGEPLLYPRMVELVDRLSSMKGVDVVSIQTNGMLLNPDKVDKLEEAGVDRINLTVNSLNEKLAKKLAGTENYDLERVLLNAKKIARSNIDLLVAPVWIKGINDEDVEDLIEYALEIGAGERWPALGIQKYREHKHGRKIESAEEIPWKEFYSQLKLWEEKYSVKLDVTPLDFGIEESDYALPVVFRKGQKVGVKIAALGWNPGQKIGVAKHRAITVVGCEDIPIGERITVEILRNKHNLYLAKPV